MKYAWLRVMYAVVAIGSRTFRSACGMNRIAPPFFCACTDGARMVAAAAAAAAPATKPRRLNAGMALLLVLRDRRLRRLEAGLAVRAVAERLGDRPATPAQREARPASARIDLRAIDVDELAVAFHQVRTVRTDGDLRRHRVRPPRVRCGQR